MPIPTNGHYGAAVNAFSGIAQAVQGKRAAEEAAEIEADRTLGEEMERAEEKLLQL